MSQWTKEREAELADLFKQGLSAGQIGAKMHVTRNAIIGKVSRLGLSRLAVVAPTVKVSPAAKPAAPIVCEAVPKPPGLSIIELNHNQCRYPFGDHDYTFCGKICVPKRPWCPEHNLLVRGWRSGGTMEVA